MFKHEPVLLQEVLAYLAPKPGQHFFDGTVGGGGHSGEILRRICPAGYLLGFDADPAAIIAATTQLQKYAKCHSLIQDNFSNFEQHSKQLLSAAPFDGILLDLGVSSYQIAKGNGRGFSFQAPDEPLDLRMDPRLKTTAADILNNASTEELVRIFKEYGEEQAAKLIACRVSENRKTKTISKVHDLLEIITAVYSRLPRPRHINPATKVFQALRIAVNRELEALEKFLPLALTYLKPGGRLAVISFHSLEDRIVKHFFLEQAKHCICPPDFPVCNCSKKVTLKIITKKPVTASVAELERNPRSRSAKLRVAEKI